MSKTKLTDTTEIVELEKQIQAENAEFKALTWAEMADFIKTHKLAEYTKDVSEKKMEDAKKKSCLCCCCPMGCAKWVRSFFVADAAKALQTQHAQLKSTVGDPNSQAF